MISFLLLVLMFISFPTMPAIAGIALAGAAYSAMHWRVGYDDLIEMIFFYGAIAGCLVAFLR